MIEVGSVVFLKSDMNSRRMTVGAIENDFAMCYWLDIKGNHAQGQFPLSVLTIDNPNPPTQPESIRINLI